MTTARTYLPQPQGNTAAVARPARPSRSTQLARLAVLAAIAACLAAAMSLLTPTAQAYARSYECPQVDVQATVLDDGTLDVAETRTFYFDGTFTAVWWTFERFYDGSTLVIDGVDVEGAAAQTGPMPEVDFFTPWRDSGGPDSPAYSYDEAELTVWAFNIYSDGYVDITLHYHVTAAVQVYDDVAELNWQFIGDQWAVSSQNVTASVQLPKPDDAVVQAGENVRVWGHGPLDGRVHALDDGTVDVSVPSVSSGEFAEVRALFPQEWMTNVPEGAPNRHAGERLSEVLEQEKADAAKANAVRIGALALSGLFILSPIGVLIWAIVMFFRYGREYRPEFKGEYWRDVPEPGVHPAVISRLWSWGKESDNDFVATLMHLTNIGAIRIDPGTYQTRKGLVNDYYLTLLPKWRDVVYSPIDSEAVSLLFRHIGKGADSVWFGSITEYGKKSPEGLMKAFNRWQSVVTAQVNQKKWFEAKGAYLKSLMRILAACLPIGALTVFLFVGLWAPFLISLPVSVALLVISRFMPRRTPPANEVNARSRALRNWLKDFSALDERPPLDVKVWGEFMVYAYIFGVAKEALKAMQVKVPEVLNDVDFGSMRYWVVSSDGYRFDGPSGMDLFDGVTHSALAGARAKIAAATAVDVGLDFLSSGGGGGGGFSGGGGGGFGGGGGGAR